MKVNAWEFFGILRDGNGTTAKSLALARDVQVSLSETFAAAAEGFRGDREVIEYNGEYKADEDELLVVHDFVLDDDLKAVLRPGLPVTILTRGDLESNARLVGVVGIDGGRKVFQRMTETALLRPKRHLLMREDTFTFIETPGLTVTDRVTAILEGSDLYFESVRAISGFLDIAQLVTEASDADIEAFQKHPGIVPTTDLKDWRLGDSWVRKRIHLIQHSDVLERNTPLQIAKAAKSRGLVVQTVKKGKTVAIVLPSDKKELKEVLRFLAEDILDSPLSDRVYRTNSKVQVGSKP